jgi:hypothetical protein
MPMLDASGQVELNDDVRGTFNCSLFEALKHTNTLPFHISHVRLFFDMPGSSSDPRTSRERVEQQLRAWFALLLELNFCCAGVI